MCRTFQFLAVFLVVGFCLTTTSGCGLFTPESEAAQEAEDSEAPAEAEDAEAPIKARVQEDAAASAKARPTEAADPDEEAATATAVAKVAAADMPAVKEEKKTEAMKYVVVEWGYYEDGEIVPTSWRAKTLLVDDKAYRVPQKFATTWHAQGADAVSDVRLPEATVQQLPPYWQQWDAAEWEWKTFRPESVCQREVTYDLPNRKFCARGRFYFHEK